MSMSKPYGRKSYTLRIRGRFAFEYDGPVIPTSAPSADERSCGWDVSVKGAWSSEELWSDLRPREFSLSKDQILPVLVAVSAARTEGDGATVRGIDGPFFASTCESFFSNSSSDFRASSAFCWRSKSSLTLSMLMCSQCETLNGSKKVPMEKSHQQRSTARMTEGNGLVYVGEIVALSASLKVVIFSAHGVESWLSRGKGCQ